MWTQTLLLLPYLAIASSLTLAITIACICLRQPVRRPAAGFAL